MQGATAINAAELTWLNAPLPPEQGRQRALYERLRHAIVNRRLAPGTRLPASRTLAAALGVARNTVLFAYEQLVAEGCLLATRHGTRVAALPDTALEVVAQAPSPGLSRRSVGVMAPDAAPDATLWPLALGVPDVASFPIRAWRASLDRAWRHATARQLSYAPLGGEPALRQALATYLSGVRGLPVTAAQVIVTAGTQNGLDLCARLLADEGDTVWVEHPGYPAAHAAFRLAGLRVRPMPVDAAGLCVTPDDWAQHPPRLVFVTPSHQFPTGAVLPLPRRLALIEQAQAHGAWIIEDDYDSEFRRSGPPPPALYGLRPGAPVVYAGTFSKTLFPALRLGYVVVPEGSAVAFAGAMGALSRPGQSIEQQALADFIERGGYTAHLRRMRPLYAQRRDALRHALARHFGADAVVTGGEAGLHLMLWWQGAPNDAAVAAAAHALGVAARPLSRYTAGGVALQNGLVLGYGATPVEVIDGAVARLAQAWWCNVRR